MELCNHVAIPAEGTLPVSSFTTEQDNRLGYRDRSNNVYDILRTDSIVFFHWHLCIRTFLMKTSFSIGILSLGLLFQHEFYYRTYSVGLFEVARERRGGGGCCWTLLSFLTEAKKATWAPSRTNVTSAQKTPKVGTSNRPTAAKSDLWMAAFIVFNDRYFNSKTKQLPLIIRSLVVFRARLELEEMAFMFITWTSVPAFLWPVL